MKKIAISLILILLVLLSFSQENDRVTIVFISQPGVNVYINGSFMLTIGSSGNATFSFSLGSSYDIFADSDYYIQVGDPLITTTSDGKTIVFLNMKPAAWIGIISNVYPLNVFVDGIYYGTLENENDMLKIPAGVHEIVISSTGYDDRKIKVALSWKEKKYIKVTLERSQPEFYLILPYSKFTPNGDWDKDELLIKIYASTSEAGTILIKNDTGKVYFKREIKLHPGINTLKWDGKNAPDGTYKLQLKVNSSGIIQEKKITLSRKEYTYKKEIILSTLALLMGVTFTLIFIAR